MKKYTIRRDSSSTRINYVQELNSAQLEVVTSKGGPTLVLAGAGTGKTRTITYRVAWLVEHGVPASEILLLTFTNKAAREMLRRSEALIGRDMSSLWGGTFHHVANRVLRRHCTRIGYREGFLILDRSDTKELFDACLSEAGVKETLMPSAAVVMDIYSFMKNTLKNLTEVLFLRSPSFSDAQEEIMKVISIYERKKGELNLMDFDDILHNFKRLLAEEAEVLDFYSRHFRHILVDEYQDTNTLQGEIVDLLTRAHRNLMVVGDDGQSIFSFRGADFTNILNFPKRYEDTRIFYLTTNYRSTPQILALANSAIGHNRGQFPKNLVSVRDEADPPVLATLENVYEQAEFVASRIIDISLEGGSLSEIAVLYRSHFQSMELQMELNRRGIPYEVRSGLKFFEQAHIKDVLSYLRIIVNPFDEISWKRVLKLLPKIGNVTADKIWKAISGSDNPKEAIFRPAIPVPKNATEPFRDFLETLHLLTEDIAPQEAIAVVLGRGYEKYLYRKYPNAQSRLEDISQMASFAGRYKTLAEFVNDMSLQAAGEEITDDAEGDRDGVVLTSIHQAKGLEWKRVFLIGLNEGRFPSFRSIQSGDDEEERRLFYVAVTRAEEELCLCTCLMSDTGFLKPSRFIKEIPKGMYEECMIERSKDNDFY